MQLLSACFRTLKISRTWITPPFSPEMTVCDVIPNPPQTPFLSQARARGARTLDGLGMLVYQGAIGFKLWTGLDAPVQVMRQALEEAFNAA